MSNETKVNLSKIIAERVENAKKALEKKLGDIQKVARGNDNYKAKCKEDTDMMIELLEKAKDKMFKHVDMVKAKKVAPSENVSVDQHCVEGYVGSVLSTISAIIEEVSLLKVNAGNIGNVYNAYTSQKPFPELTARLVREPIRGEMPMVNRGSVGYFDATVEVSYSGPMLDGITYRLKYRYKQKGTYSSFEMTESIPKESGVARLERLVPGSEYEVFGQVGMGGLYGDMSMQPCCFKTKPLEPPKNFQVEKVGFVDMALKWDPIEVPPGIGFGILYKVTIKQTGSNERAREELTKSANDSTLKIEKLIPGVNYDLCIATGTENKDLPFGQPSESITKKTKPIDPPAEMRARQLCDSIVLEWEDKRKEISSDDVNVFYKVQYRLYEDGNPRDKEEDSSFIDIYEGFCPMFVCKGLEKDVKYEFRVRSGVRIISRELDIDGHYLSADRKTATVAAAIAGTHAWACCVCREELHGEKKKALPKEAKIGFVWYCTRVT